MQDIKALANYDIIILTRNLKNMCENVVRNFSTPLYQLDPLLNAVSTNCSDASDSFSVFGSFKWMQILKVHETYGDGIIISL